MRKALDGIRVLDLSQWLQGPVCAQYLADFGAEVIHVERPVSGDSARGVRSIKALAIGDWNQYFQVINRGKKSLAIDLKNPEGQELFYELVEKSDVLLSNFVAENLKAWGLTWEKLRERNPRLVFATNFGYGHAREISRPSYDINVQGLTGLMTRQGEPGEPPHLSWDGLRRHLRRPDVGLRHHARAPPAPQDGTRPVPRCLSLRCAALHGRAHAPALPGAPRPPERSFYSMQQSRKEARNPLWNRYQVRDKWVFLCLEDTDENWAALCESLERPELASDARFESAGKRAEHNAELVALLDSILQEQDSEDWIARCRSLGIPAAPIQNLKDVSGDAQAWENDYLLKVHCGEVNREVDIRGLPITLSKTPGRVESLGPELGQDTELLLMDLLEMEWDRISELKERGVIP